MHGATLPFLTYLAAFAQTSGMLLGPSRHVGDISNEACGRRAVQLDAQGQSITFISREAANSIVVRYSIPDRTDATLSLYIDGKFRQKLSLTSRYSHTYGGFHIPYSKDPAAGKPMHFFDECRALCGEIPAGARVTLQKDADDQASFYVVDLIDLEQVGAPLAQPAGSLSAADFGAKGDGVSDDSWPLQECLNASAANNKAAWIGPGTYRLTAPLVIPPVTLKGAGIWHTTLRQVNDTGIFNMNVGGGACHLSDFSMLGEVLNRVDSTQDNALNRHAGNGSTLTNVWIEHTKCGWWVGAHESPHPTENLTISRCRFRNLYADGVNFCNGSSHSTITQCHFRNTGDDAMASWAPKRTGVNSGNLFSFNTVQAPWRANCAAIYGGKDNRIEDNLFEDTSNYPGILIGREFNCHPFAGRTIVQRNTLRRCGGVFDGKEHGALKLSAEQGPLQGIECRDLRIEDPTFKALDLPAKESLIGCSFSGILKEAGNAP